MSTRAPHRVGVAAALLTAVALLSSCTGGGTGVSASADGAGPDAAAAAPTTTSPTTTTAAAATLAVSVTDGATEVSALEPVTVTASGGTLSVVELVGPDGTAVPGVLSVDGLSWTSSEPLAYESTYRVAATALNARQVPATTSSSFTTVEPANLTLPYLNPTDGEVVGVGQSAAVRFDEPVADKAAAEAAITVTTTPAVEGAFYWLNDQEVRWRPQEYWAPGTQVQVDAAVYGKDMGEGIYGQADVSSSFTIGDAVVSTADDATKTLSISVGGEVVRTMPISMGKDSTPTDNGVYIVADQHAEYTMDSSTYGVPEDAPGGYVTEVQYASRMSYSGIFVHGAPWSVADQGVRNVSHGCLNVSVEDARWFYENVGKGDIVVVQGTVGPTLAGNEGLGDWNVPWAEWQAGGYR